MRNRALLVRCDVPGCPATELAVYRGSYWAHDPWDRLLAEGWILRGDTDLCPDHNMWYTEYNNNNRHNNGRPIT